MSYIVQSYWRSFRSIFPTPGGNDEKVQFARFENEGAGKSCPSFDQTELSTLQANGSLGARPGDDPTTPGGPTTPGTMDGFPGEEEEGGEKKVEQITEWQAGWNVTNAIQGMFIVTFPYSVYQGGYWAIFAMILIAWICCYTGKILVDCLYEESPSGERVRVRGSYVAIAEEVWGPRIGGRIVNCAQIIELLMTCILYVLLCGDLMIGSFPDTSLDLSSWIMISAALLMPCAFLRSLRHVSWLSFWCTVAHMFINAIILIYCFTRAGSWHWSSVQIKIDIWTFPIALGVVIFSYTSQIFLPTLEGKLTRPEKFHCMMHWTHIAAAVFKALFSYVGFLTWGFQTKEVITNNLPIRSLRVIVNLFLVAKALLSYPLPYFAAVELLEETFFRGRPLTLFPSCVDSARRLKVWAVTFRLALVVFTLLMAIFCPHFSILMGLVGSITGNCLSLVWPCYFHLRIKTLTVKQKAADVSIILFGLVCAVLGIYYSSHALVMAFEGHESRPFQGAMT